MEIKVSVVSQEETRGFVERGGDWIGIARDLMKIRQQIKELEAQEKRIAQALKSHSEGLCSKGGGFVWSASYRKGSVDYASIPQLRGIDLEQYRKDSIEVWSLSYEVSL